MVNAYLDSRGQTTKNQVKNLGVILETDLSFSSHVKAVTKSAYYHLKNIARIMCFVSSQDLEKLVHAFITSRVDYCNGLLASLPKNTIRQLQLIQNAAARFLTRTRKSEHITPVLGSLHWLPVIFRIDFKVLLLIYKWPRLWLDYGAAGNLDCGAAGGLDSGAAAVSGLRTEKELGTVDRKRDADLSADRTDWYAGSAILAPRSALFDVHLRAWG